MPHHFPPLNRFPLALMTALPMIPYPPFPSPNEGVGEPFVDETGATQIYTQEMHDEFLDKLDIWCHMSKEERTEYKTAKKEKEVGRNDPCPCGSGKKFKKCCLK